MNLQRPALIGACVAAMLAWSGIGQTQSPVPQPVGRSAAPSAAKATFVRGRVTTAELGQPLRRARVMLAPTQGNAGGPPVSAYTNSAGRFEFRDVAPGTYFLTATRAGYISVQYGQRRPRERGVAVEVRAGETVERIDFALPRGGVLSGFVTDEAGEAYPGVEVDALQLRYDRGRRVPTPVGGTTTDDQGGFRLANLEPGNYYLVASSPETWRTEKKETFGYASTYYPGGPIDRAQRLQLGTSEVKTGLHLALQAGRTFRVAGRVVRETGETMPNAGVTLAYSFPGVTITPGSRSVRARADGSFEFKDVAGGTYVVMTTAASQTVAVASADVVDVQLLVRTGSTVSGTLMTDDGSAPPFGASGVRVLLDAPTGDVLPTVRVVSVDSDWSFKLEGLGGPFVFRLTGLPDDWVLGSVRLGDKDITDKPWDVPTGGQRFQGLTLVVTQKVGVLSGSVMDVDKPSADAVVVVFADDPELWMPGSRFIRTTRPGSDGRFSIKGLPAGSYLAIARAFIEDGQGEDPEFLEQSRVEAAAFTLSEGGSETVTLKLPKKLD
jgi:hypothetical protein